MRSRLGKATRIGFGRKVISWGRRGARAGGLILVITSTLAHLFNLSTPGSNRLPTMPLIDVHHPCLYLVRPVWVVMDFMIILTQFMILLGSHAWISVTVPSGHFCSETKLRSPSRKNTNCRLGSALLIWMRASADQSQKMKSGNRSVTSWPSWSSRSGPSTTSIKVVR